LCKLRLGRIHFGALPRNFQALEEFLSCLQNIKKVPSVVINFGPETVRLYRAFFIPFSNALHSYFVFSPLVEFFKAETSGFWGEIVLFYDFSTFFLCKYHFYFFDGKKHERLAPAHLS